MGEYLRGTQYGERAAERPQEFFGIIDANKKAAEATERLRVEILKLAGAA